MAKAPPKPVPRTPESFCCSPWGSAISKAPNMLAASASRKSASTKTTAGDDSTVPKALPESAAKSPNPEYMAAMPPT